MNDASAAPTPRIAVPERLDAASFAAFDPTAQIAEIAGATMGTRWQVRAALPMGFDASGLEAALQTRLDAIVAEMSHWEAASLLSRFNTAGAGSWHYLPRDFAAVVAASLEVAELSHGAFDPALGRLTDAWGLGPRAASAPPSEAAIATALEASGWRHLAFDRDAQRLRQPGGFWLDLSGIAKGYTADALADQLGELGIHHALVEVGGECVGRGLRPDGDPWWVELEIPPGLYLEPIRLALHQLAVATSGDYLRGAHTIDPRTGQLALDGAMAVSVVHTSCMMADAWASAFVVLPESEARALAEQQDLAVRAVTRDGREWLSSPLQAMLC